MEYQVFPNILCLLHCVPLYVCRLCINYQDLSTNLLGVAALRMLLLTFISHFVIDFLSIRKVIITPHAQRERGKVIDRGVHVCGRKKYLNRTLEIDSPFQTLTVVLVVEFSWNFVFFRIFSVYRWSVIPYSG